MKKLAILLMFCFGIIGTSMSQQIHQVRIDAQKEFLVDQIKSGGFELFFNINADASEIRRNAKFYESYFDVLYDESNGSCRIVFKDESQMSRRVVERFLLSNNISQVIIGEEAHTIEGFLNLFLN